MGVTPRGSALRSRADGDAQCRRAFGAAAASARGSGGGGGGGRALLPAEEEEPQKEQERKSTVSSLPASFSPKKTARHLTPLLAVTHFDSYFDCVCLQFLPNPTECDGIDDVSDLTAVRERRRNIALQPAGRGDMEKIVNLSVSVLLVLWGCALGGSPSVQIGRCPPGAGGRGGGKERKKENEWS